MRGTLSVEDFIKLAAGLLAGLFVLVIVWIYVANIISTQCWKDAMAPFDEALLGTKSLQAPLGNKDSFSVQLNLDKECLQEIFFLHGKYSESDCGDACTKGIKEGWIVDDKHKSSVVQDCMIDCAKYCAGGKGCIMLMPLPKFTSNFIALNKPRVYGSGDYKFQYPFNPSEWKNKTIKPGSSERCIVFTKLGDGRTYSVNPTANAGECK